jgi:hypothetical protein
MPVPKSDGIDPSHTTIEAGTFTSAWSMTIADTAASQFSDWPRHSSARQPIT